MRTCPNEKRNSKHRSNDYHRRIQQGATKAATMAWRALRAEDVVPEVAEGARVRAHGA